MITPFNIYFNARLIWQKHEFWRLFTNFFYFGNLGGCPPLPAAGAGLLPACRGSTPLSAGLSAARRAALLAASPTYSPTAVLIRPCPLPPALPAGLDFFFHMFFLVKYSKSLEEGSFRNRPADFLWMLLVGAGVLVAAAPWVNIQFLGSSLTFMMVRGVWCVSVWLGGWVDADTGAAVCIGVLQTVGCGGGRTGTASISHNAAAESLFSLSPLASLLLLLQVYVWGRRHQYVNLSFLGIFTFTAPYLPWVLLAFSGLRRQGAAAACSCSVCLVWLAGCVGGRRRLLTWPPSRLLLPQQPLPTCSSPCLPRYFPCLQ